MCDYTFFWKLTQVILIFSGESKRNLFGPEAVFRFVERMNEGERERVSERRPTLCHMYTAKESTGP